MECKKCGSGKVLTQTNYITTKKSRSLIWNLIMIFFTGGIWLVWMLIRKPLEDSRAKTVSTCQDCGFGWEL